MHRAYAMLQLQLFTYTYTNTHIQRNNAIFSYMHNIQASHSVSCNFPLECSNKQSLYQKNIRNANMCFLEFTQHVPCISGMLQLLSLYLPFFTHIQLTFCHESTHQFSLPKHHRFDIRPVCVCFTSSNSIILPLAQIP